MKTTKDYVLENMAQFNAKLASSDMNAVKTMLNALIDYVEPLWLKESIRVVMNYADTRSKDWEEKAKKYDND